MNTITATTAQAVDLTPPLGFERILNTPARVETTAPVSSGPGLTPWRVAVGIRYGIFNADKKNSQGLGFIETVVSDPLSPTMNPLMTATPGFTVRTALTKSKPLPDRFAEDTPQYAYFDAVLNARTQSQANFEFIGRGAIPGRILVNADDFQSQQELDQWLRTFMAARTGVSYTYKFGGKIVDTDGSFNAAAPFDMFAQQQSTPLPKRTWKTGYASLGVYFDVLHVAGFFDQSQSYPHLRLELGMAGNPSKVTKVLNPTQSGGEAYAVLEVDLRPELLTVIKDAAGEHFSLKLDDATALDATDLVAPMSADFKAKIPTADPDADIEVINLATAGEDALDKLTALIPADMQETAQSLASAAPVALNLGANALTYGPSVVKGLGILRNINGFLSSGAVQAAGNTLGKTLVVGDILMTAAEGATDPWSLEYFSSGAAQPNTKAEYVLANDDITVDAPTVDGWLHNDGDKAPELLDLFQTYAADPNAPSTGKDEANKMIAQVPSFHLLNALETQARALGVVDAGGADLAHLAESIIATAPTEAQARARAQMLHDQFGITFSTNPETGVNSWYVSDVKAFAKAAGAGYKGDFQQLTKDVGINPTDPNPIKSPSINISDYKKPTKPFKDK